MKHLVLPGLALLTLAAPTLADGFDRARVPADARLVAHVDVEAVVRSRLVQELQRLEPDLDVDFDLGDEVPLLAGVRPLRDVRSITLFAVDPERQRVGAVVRLSEKADALLQIAQGLDQYESLDIEGYTVHSWSESEHQRAFASLFPVQGSGDRLVLVSNDPALMGRGLAVLSGRAPSLAAQTEGMLGIVPEPGGLVFVASDKSLGELGDLDPTSSVARLVQGFALQLGEAQGNVFAHLVLQAASPQEVQRVQQVLQGFTALAGLVAMDAEHGQSLQGLVNALRYRGIGDRLYVEFSYELLALIDTLHALEDGR